MRIKERTQVTNMMIKKFVISDADEHKTTTIQISDIPENT